MIRLELCGLWTLMQQRTLVGELQRQLHSLMCKWHHYRDFDISISVSIFLETPSLPKKYFRRNPCMKETIVKVNFDHTVECVT